MPYLCVPFPHPTPPRAQNGSPGNGGTHGGARAVVVHLEREEVERPLMAQLEAMGWTRVPGVELDTPDASVPLLVDQLGPALRRIDLRGSDGRPWRRDDDIRRAVKELGSLSLGRASYRRTSPGPTCCSTAGRFSSSPPRTAARPPKSTPRRELGTAGLRADAVGGDVGGSRARCATWPPGRERERTRPLSPVKRLADGEVFRCLGRTYRPAAGAATLDG